MHFNARKEDVWLLNPLLLVKRRHKFPTKLHLIRQKKWTYSPSYSHLDPLFELCAYAEADLKFEKGKYGRQRRDQERWRKNPLILTPHE